MDVIFTIAKQLTFRITKTWTTERINVSEQINGKCTGYKQRTTTHATLIKWLELLLSNKSEEKLRRENGKIKGLNEVINETSEKKIVSEN